VGIIQKPVQNNGFSLFKACQIEPLDGIYCIDL
jgi:hypothetical protein